MKNEIVGIRLDKNTAILKSLNIDKLKAKENEKLKKVYFNDVVSN